MESDMTGTLMVAEAVNIIHDILISDALSPVHRAALEKALTIILRLENGKTSDIN